MAALQRLVSPTHSRALAACVTFFAFTPLTTPTADATSFEDLTLEQLAAQSDVVAIGTVIATHAFPEGPSGQAGIHVNGSITHGARR